MMDMTDMTCLLMGIIKRFSSYLLCYRLCIYLLELVDWCSMELMIRILEPAYAMYQYNTSSCLLVSSRNLNCFLLESNAPRAGSYHIKALVMSISSRIHICNGTERLTTEQNSDIVL